MEVVVVGVDGSETANRALRFAVRQVRFRQGILRAVYAWQNRTVIDFGGIGGVMPDDLGDQLAEGAKERLDEALAEVDLDGIRVERRVVEGPAAQSILAAAEEGDVRLICVGSRGRGGFTGLLLGSVSQQLANHARCPVAIIPPHADTLDDQPVERT
jgi:nucleotide-binding universal stress UspA family protein